MKSFLIFILFLSGLSIQLKAQVQQIDLSAFLNKTEVRRISVQENTIKRPPLRREFELVTELTKSINNDTCEGAFAPRRI